MLNYPTENGRRYHAFREGAYYFPNDEEEQDRMDIHHEMAVKAGGGKLHLAPLTNPGRILDIGTGTGITFRSLIYPRPCSLFSFFSPPRGALVRQPELIRGLIINF